MSPHQFNLYRLAWPVFVSQVAGGLVGFVDIAFISQINEEAAGAVGIVTPYLLIAFVILPILSTVGITVAAQYTGAGQKQFISPSYLLNLLICSLFGLLFFALTVLFHQQIGLWFNLSHEVNRYVSDYLLVFAPAFVLLGVSFAYGAILAVRGKTRWNMYIAVTSNVLNIFLDAVFVFGWFGIEPMGIKGVALASIIAFSVGLLLNFYVLHKLEGIRFSRDDFAKQRGLLRPFVSIGVPTMLEPFSYVFQQMVVMSLVALLGATAMAANTFVLRLHFIEIALGASLATAAQIMLGHFAGAREHERAEQTLYRALKVSCCFALFNMLLVLLFYRQVLGLFTSDPEVVAVSYQLILICLLMEPFRQLNIVLGRALKAVGDAKFPAIVGMGFMWAMMPVAYLVGIEWQYGVLGLWWCFAMDEVIRGSINLWRWRTGRWRDMAIVEQAQASAA
ncbi:MATE family efflux transporter [Aliagarivorans marinus]|uniref:MATE family efflux transporter n=1 Tax=Aliagarivorans marinus TaxID=561965 RepID=UPI000400DAFF|nr:MATE family efflux transporter [Aliagarivorans marinus]